MSFLASPHFLIGLVADQLLPHQCLLCGKFCVGRGVCAACWAGASPISASLCDRCGRPLPHALPDQRCGQCWRTLPPLATIYAGFVYNALSRALILRFKHADGQYLTPVLGQFLARVLQKDYPCVRTMFLGLCSWGHILGSCYMDY